MGFCVLRVLARILGRPFGHPTQVSAQVQLAVTCDYLRVRLTRALHATQTYQIVFSSRSSQTNVDYLVTEIVMLLLHNWNMFDKATTMDAWGRSVKFLVFHIMSWTFSFFLVIMTKFTLVKEMLCRLLNLRNEFLK